MYRVCGACWLLLPWVLVVVPWCAGSHLVGLAISRVGTWAHVVQLYTMSSDMYTYAHDPRHTYASYMGTAPPHRTYSAEKTGGSLGGATLLKLCTLLHSLPCSRPWSDIHAVKLCCLPCIPYQLLCRDALCSKDVIRATHELV